MFFSVFFNDFFQSYIKNDKKNENQFRTKEGEFEEKASGEDDKKGTHITLDDIQGRWTNSNDDIFLVTGKTLKFIDDKEIFEIKESEQKFEVNDWVLEKSSVTLTWKQENEEDVLWYRLQTVT